MRWPRDHGISRATAYRYLDEVVIVLAEQAPDLREALERAKDKGFSHLILDGKIIPCDRCKEPAVSVRGEVIDLWYSGKAHAHGGNVRAVLAPDGFPLWVSQVEPGSVHDIAAARAGVWRMHNADSERRIVIAAVCPMARRSGRYGAGNFLPAAQAREWP